jgi:hypothetical protein
MESVKVSQCAHILKLKTNEIKAFVLKGVRPERILVYSSWIFVYIYTLLLPGVLKCAIFKYTYVNVN